MATYEETDDGMDYADDTQQIVEVDTEAELKALGVSTSGEIKRTKFSVPYRSRFTLMKVNNNKKTLETLGHAPCSYTCTAGLAPSLLELKQHAHDLVVMIKNLTVSTMPGVIDNINIVTGADIKNPEQVPFFEEGETFDFLNDLANPYAGPREGHPFAPALRAAHEHPLTALLNVLEEKNIPKKGEARPLQKIRNICPLHRVADLEKLPPTGQSLPYATHQSLIQHANEILELLDHEYSAKGGILSILPSKDQKADREKAESTLLGQMILYTQRLVQRVHDLERLYANAMDVMAGEAIVPPQTLSRLGPDGRSGREMVYPQDRFVLVNAGEDVWSHLSHEFDKKEAIDELVMESYRKIGTTGEMIWKKRGGREMDRGITAIDVTTRYYRLRGTEKDDPKTIFIIPAWEQHPGTKVTRDMERTPSVVSVVKPVWPERASLWEQKHRADLDDLKKYRALSDTLHFENKRKTEEITALRSQYELRAGELRKERALSSQALDALNGSGNEAKKAHIDLVRQADIDKSKTQEALKEAEKLKKKAEEDAALREKERKEAQATVEQLTTQLRQKRQQLEDAYAQKIHDLEQKDLEAGENQRKLAEVLRGAWQEQITQTQTLMEQVRRGDNPQDPPSSATVDIARMTGEKIVNSKLGQAAASRSTKRLKTGPGYANIRDFTMGGQPVPRAELGRILGGRGARADTVSESGRESPMGY